MNNYTPTTSFELPQVVSNMLPTPNAGLAQSGFAGFPQYQEGGMVGPGGMPIRAGMVPQAMPAAQAGVSPQLMESEINRLAMQNPEQVNQIKQAIQEGLQSGELTPQELNMITQLATVAAQNPEMYPYVRNFAIQQGIATEADLPVQYDAGLIFALLLAARAAQELMRGQSIMQGGQPPMGQVAMPQVSSGAIPSMAKGGPVPGGGGESKPVVIEAHTGEYVIPKHVVDMKGKEFFDNLVSKYSGS